MVSLMIDDTSYLVLLTLKYYGRPLDRRNLHVHLYKLIKKTGLNFDFKFYGKPPFSPDIERRVEELIEKGLVRRLFVVGPAYTTLYREYVKLSEEGKELLDSLPSKGFEEVVENYFEGLRGRAKPGEESGA